MQGARVRATVAMLVAILLWNALPVPAADGLGLEPVVVAVLDSGVYSQHEAFDSDQLVAWYDFSMDGGPDEPQVTWDPRVEPYDDGWHGTAVASMVAGAGSQQTASHAPGAKLAIGKVSSSGGTSANDLARGIRWATDIVGADVITISIWWDTTIWPGHPATDAIEYARSQGVLVTVLAGNNEGPSWLNPPATSPHALVVGGAWAPPARFYGLLTLPEGTPSTPWSAMEPEVTASFYAWTAHSDCPSCYVWSGGTSFSTPLVAGMAAGLVLAARQAGLPDPGPDRLEELLKWAAFDSVLYPPSNEGYGYLADREFDAARDHLLAGTRPNADNPIKQASALWVETPQAAGRQALSGGSFGEVRVDPCCAADVHAPGLPPIGFSP